ncbi:MAG TPA: hypothetical protein VE693_04270 [Gaiellaceae bacterium]|jgi:hypothetical protein|nr:hypothetical protein [Gaiellaceae bacterium]
MKSPTLVFQAEREGRTELVVNFGVYSGREATEAEIRRLAQTLLEELESVEIVAERRYEFDAGVEATVHQVRVVVPRAADGLERDLTSIVSDWAHDCIGERHHLTP